MPQSRRQPITVAAAALLAASVAAQVTPYAWRSGQIYGGGFVTASVYNRAVKGLMYARTDMGGAYRFNASDDSWAPLQDDLGLNNQSYWGTLSLATDAAQPNRVYLATGLYTNGGAALAAVLFSDAYGATGSWTAVTLPGVRLGGNEDGRSAGERLAIDGANNTRLYLGTSHSGLWTSSNFGRAWAASPSWPKTAALQSLNFVVIDDTLNGTTPSLVFVGAAATSNSLWSSSDSGVTWAPVAGAPSGLIPYRMALDRAARTAYLTYADHVGPNGMTRGQVWKYVIASGAWSNVTPPNSVSPAGGGFAGVAVDAQRSGVVMVTTMDVSGRIRRKGAAWLPLNIEYAAFIITAALGPRRRHPALYRRGRHVEGPCAGIHPPQRRPLGLLAPAAVRAGEEGAGIEYIWAYAPT